MHVKIATNQLMRVPEAFGPSEAVRLGAQQVANIVEGKV